MYVDDQGLGFRGSEIKVSKQMIHPAKLSVGQTVQLIIVTICHEDPVDQCLTDQWQ